MDVMEIMRSRHSVRQYLPRKIEEEKRAALNELAQRCNAESGMNIQLIYDEPECFDALFAKVASFRGCGNYIALVGRKDDPQLEEKSGYYGEQLVLKAQELGLNTCWVGLTRGRSAAAVGSDEKQTAIIALGYGANQGTAHKNKPISQLSSVTENLPDWYARGLEAAMLAPTAVNQQKFRITLEGEDVTITAEKGPFSRMDLGIVKYHFEAASGHAVR